MFSIDLTESEILFLRKALEIVQIQGKDAKFLCDLQRKLEFELNEMAAKEEKK